MSISKVQSITGSGATLTLNGVAAGNLLTMQDSYVRTVSTGAAEAVPTDTQGVWSVANSDAPPGIVGDDTGVGIFFQDNVASGTHTVTPEANSIHHTTLVEWSGAATVSLDQHTSAKSTAANHTSQATGTTGTTSQADELVLICCVEDSTAGTTDIGWTDPVAGFATLQKVVNDTTDLPTLHAFQIINATGPQSATFNWTDSTAVQVSMANIATFKAVTVTAAALIDPAILI